MALMFLIMLTTTHLEDTHLVATTVGKHRDSHRSPGNQRCANDDPIVFANRQHLFERDDCTDVRRYLFYFQFFSDGNAILLATGFYDRVHGDSPCEKHRTGHVIDVERWSQPSIGGSASSQTQIRIRQGLLTSGVFQSAS